MNATPAEMEALGRQLWGAVNRTQSTRDEIRFGTNGSKSIDLPKRVWHDHETGEGGGFNDLYAKVHGTRPQGDGIAACYDYCDEAGRMLFQVVRKTPKKFLQRRPDGNGGWTWNLGSVERVPYKLRELLKSAIHAPVFVCEGEKDVDELRAHGLTATCNPGGAGKWLASLSGHLRDRHIVILPDNDAPGEAHALEVAAKLRGIASSIRIVHLPGLPPKGDVSDWLAAGGTAEQLEQLAREAPELGAETEPEAEPDTASEARKLREHLAIEAWAERDIPAPDRLLGHLLTTTARLFLVGQTGLGKTMLGFAMACGVASGTGFLHWRSARPARVLYIDGEMPGELIKARAIDAMRRASAPPPGNLVIYARDMEERFAALFPSLGLFKPLNTEEGHNFIHRLIAALGGVDLVIFDNVMSLIVGDQKDEVPWNETLSLVASLTSKRIGQIWLDHTGHNTVRQYGSSTKAWRFDAVGVMTALSDDQRAPREMAFNLSFEPPAGKARRRTPANWQDFETCTIRLRDDQWTSEPATGARSDAKMTPQCRQFYRALLDAFTIAEPPGRTTRAAWYAECVRTGLTDPIVANDGWRAKDAKQSKLRKYMTEIKTAGLIGVDGETIHDLRKTRTETA